VPSGDVPILSVMPPNSVVPEPHRTELTLERESPRGAVDGRRTVMIRGQVAPARRRPPRRAVDRVGHRPDRIALWALVLGVMLILAAVAT